MILSTENKILIGIVVATIAILFGGVFFINKNQPPAGNNQTNTPIDPTILVRENSHKISTDSAKVTIVEFSDFQCPSCGQAHPMIKKIQSEYAGKINFVYRNYPLPSHLNSFNAALAAESADQQGKFWEMHDRLFENQAIWGNSDKWMDIFVGYAKDLGMDVNKFRSDMDSQTLGEKIKADQADGDKLGVNATPTFFVNNTQIVGADYNLLKKTIDSFLK